MCDDKNLINTEKAVLRKTELNKYVK